MTTPAPWLRQPGETSAMFAAFCVYLALTPPRSIDAAFRQRYPEKAAGKRRDSGVILTANGTWQNWAHSKTSNGTLIPDMPTWAQRAAAWDDHLHALRIAEWEQRHMSAVEAVARLSDMGRASIADFADVKTAEDLKKHPLGHLVHELETIVRRASDGQVTARIKLKLHNSQRALELIGKKHALFTDKVEHSGEVTQNIKGYTVLANPNDWPDGDSAPATDANQDI